MQSAAGDEWLMLYYQSIIMPACPKTWSELQGHSALNHIAYRAPLCIVVGAIFPKQGQCNVVHQFVHGVSPPRKCYCEVLGTEHVGYVVKSMNCCNGFLHE